MTSTLRRSRLTPSTLRGSRAHKSRKLSKGRTSLPKTPRCKRMLRNNISAMMKEYRDYNRWQSHAQAVAVAYSKTRKSCLASQHMIKRRSKPSKRKSQRRLKK